MKLLEDIIASLPEGHALQEAYIGAFDTVVRSVRWGLSATFRDPCAGDAPAWVRGAGELVGRPALEIARLALSDRLLEASLGMAAINSLLEPFAPEPGELNAAKLIAERGRGKDVAVIGEFPFLEKIRPELKSLRTVSRPPWEGEAGLREAERILPGAEVVAITGSSFINHTAERLLELCPRAYTVVLGPTTPLTPVLFRYGVDAICAAVIADPDRLLPGVWQGAPFRRLAGVRLVTAFRDGRQA